MPTAARPAWLAAGAALLLLCLAFTPEIAAAVRVWNQSTAYGHCWLVQPIAAWLLWERRAVLRVALPRPTAWPALAALPIGLVWVAANLLGTMEGRQLALLSFAELLLIAALGWRLWWALSPAFLYLLFLVPFGAFLTPTLQHFTTNFILSGLRALDIPYESNAFQITIPEGAFYVAEACAGLRFLIASIAFGVLYAVTIFRSPWRRAAFIAVACAVPVIANGFRGLGIVLLGHLLGSAEAGAADHLIYGWVFFSVVIIMLALGGLPFREDWTLPSVPPDASSPPPRPAKLLAATSLVLAVSLAGPLSLGLMDARPPGALTATVPRITLPDGCRAAVPTIAGPVSTQTIQCGSATFRVLATTLPAASNPARTLATARDAASRGLPGEIDSQTTHLPSGATWLMLRTHEPEREAAYAVIQDGAQLTDGVHDRLKLARGMWGHHQTVAISVTADGAPVGALQTFLDAQGRKQGLLF